MKLIAAGRASEIFNLGDGRVLRRFKTRGDPYREALVMRHAALHGYAVPRVFGVMADARARAHRGANDGRADQGGRLDAGDQCVPACWSPRPVARNHCSPVAASSHGVILCFISTCILPT